MSDRQPRYWNDFKRAYTSLDEFGSVSLAVRAAAPDVWDGLHPPELSVDQRARQIAERRTGMPAYLVDDEVWDAALAEAKAELPDESAEGWHR